MNFVGAPLQAHSVVRRSVGPVADSLRHMPLEPGKIWARPAPVPGDRVEVIAGHVWVTQAGEPRDIVLAPGQVWSMTKCGKVVVQALTAARVRVVTGRRVGRLGRIARAWAAGVGWALRTTSLK